MDNKSIALTAVIGASLGASVGAAFRGLTAQSQKTASELKKLKLGEALAGDLAKYRAQLLRLQTAQREGTHDAAQLKAQISTVMTSYQKAREAAAKYGIDVHKVAAEQKNLGDQVKYTEGVLKRQRSLIANRELRADLRGKMVAAVVGAGAVAEPIRQAIAFESVMADVRKVVNFDTVEQFRELRQEALKMSTEMPMAAEGIGAIMTAAGQSQVARGELAQFTRDAIKMGVAFDLSGAEAGDIMTSWRAGMALTQQQAVRLADAVNYLGNKIKAPAGKLSEVLKRQGAVSLAAGLSEVQAASLAAALLSGGTEPEIAATALKNFVGALTRGHAATRRQRLALGELGLDSGALAKGMQKNPVGTIRKVFSALGRAPVAEQGGYVTQLFGEESKGPITNLIKNQQNLAYAFDLTAKDANFAGSMLAEYEVRSKTTANALQLLENRTKALGITTGDTLLKPLTFLSQIAGVVLDFARSASERFPLLTTALTSSAAGLIGFRLASLGAQYAWSGLLDMATVGKGVWAFITNPLKWAAGATRAWAVAQWALNAAMSPMFLGLAAVAGTLYLLYRFRTPIGKAFEGFAEGSKAFGQRVDRGFAWALESARNAAGSVASAILPNVPLALAAGHSTVNAQITVHAAPGRERAAAEEIDRVLREREMQAAARSRGRLHD